MRKRAIPSSRGRSLLADFLDVQAGRRGDFPVPFYRYMLVVAVFRQLPAGPALRPEGTHKVAGAYCPGSAQTAFRTPFVKSSSAWSV